ncbi:urea transport system ATP-binding protein [Cupriavidus sp. YR651]|uniref:urea ABC transporter ATP-binding protein UrtD n=1 Tax=Cupriavidus sp. YR651 TaxID=1855315 RepID=UPI00088B1A1E|nr:urea ABC transporter ATP-binding protein UrtD [Cupriavidus sp. YR651]SDD25655.1 urea transport system ATP-binding protein [Cupriavidus sp. YR651]
MNAALGAQQAESGNATGLGRFVEPGVIDVSHGPILYLEDLTVQFDGFRALNKLTLSIDHGELRCVIGPNGAGKTTMMDVITGKTGPRNANVSGRVFLGQTIDLMRMTEPRIAQTGIGRKFQKPTVFEQHAVWENLELAMKTDKRWWSSLRARLTGEGHRRIEETLALTGLEDEAYRPAGLLSHGQKQRLEIGMLLMQQPQLLLLDEPVAGMTDEETMQLAGLLNSLRGSCSMMVVEHDMEFVAALAGDAGKVTVLAEGSVLAEGTLDAVKRDERVIESYLGR